MPMYLKRADGSASEFKNSYFLPYYYFIPYELFNTLPPYAKWLPRNFEYVSKDQKSINFVESDLFLQIVQETMSYLVWSHISKDKQKEIYSMNDPIYRMSYATSLWVDGLIKEGVLPTIEYVAQRIINSNANDYIGFITQEYADGILDIVVPNVLKEHNLNDIFETVRSMRCFEDFDDRKSLAKKQFFRKWYHSRTQHPQISLEELQDDYRKAHNGADWDAVDEFYDVEDICLTKIELVDFWSTLAQTDKLILEYRLYGYSHEEITKMLGYKTHSAITKRINKIGRKFEKYAGVDYGFSPN